MREHSRQGRIAPTLRAVTESIFPPMALWRRLALPVVLMLSAEMAMGVQASETNTPRAVHEESQVTLVQVPVWVTDKSGKAIRGLQPSDFTIEDEGAHQKIEAVDVVDLAQKSAVSSGERNERLLAGRRHFLMLFDLSYATPAEVLRAQSAAERFLSGGTAPEDLAAVATISAEKGASLLVTFTSDRRQLVAAIRSLDLPGTIASASDPLAFASAIPGGPSLAKIFVGETMNPRGNVSLLSAMHLSPVRRSLFARGDRSGRASC
jgi:VWFA-related protein